MGPARSGRPDDKLGDEAIQTRRADYGINVSGYVIHHSLSLLCGSVLNPISQWGLECGNISRHLAQLRYFLLLCSPPHWRHP